MAGRKQIENAPLLIARQKFLKRFEQLLTDLQNFSTNGFFRQTIQRFRLCIKPDEALGESQLPFLSSIAASRRRNKDNCVLCVLSYTVKLYWELYKGDLDLENSVDAHLTRLENYAKDGKKAYKIIGVFPEYYLGKIK